MMGHYTPRLLLLAAQHSGGSGSSTADGASASMLEAVARTASTGQPSGGGQGLLSPEQQLILQLESAGLGCGGSAAGVSPQNRSLDDGTFSLFPGAGSTAMTSAALDLSGPAAAAAAQAAALQQAAGTPGGLPLAALDVRGCSAVETVVLMLSWLGHLVQAVAAGQALPGAALRIDTGAAGPLDYVQLQGLELAHPVVETKQQQVPAPAPAPADAAALQQSTGSGAAEEEEEDNRDGAAAATAVEAAAAAAAAADILDIPGAHVSAHNIALAVLSGQLGQLLGCGNAMQLLLPFSAAGRLPLGVLCMGELPLLLLDEAQGGGLLLPTAGVAAAIAAALQAAGV
jgi:hypothetical protein